jgi:hypothetical protein
LILKWATDISQSISIDPKFFKMMSKDSLVVSACSSTGTSPKETDEPQITQFSEASQKEMELFGTRFINRQSELVHAIRNIAVEVNFLPLHQ